MPGEHQAAATEPGRKVELFEGWALRLYLATLALLPWGTWPPFPWLHERAQWSDVALAAAVGTWLAHQLRRRAPFRPRPFDIALGSYLAWAALSHAASGAAGAAGWKLLGIGELVVLAALTARVAAAPAVRRQIVQVVAWTSLAVGAAAVAGVFLFLAGRPTPLVGSYGDLLPGAYVRAQAGLPHPNLLASYCIFASAVVAHRDASLPAALRRVTQTLLALTVMFTFSRALLGFVLAFLVRRAVTPGRRRLAAAWALTSVAVLALLVHVNVALDPTRPWELSVQAGPSSRQEAAVTAAETLASRPWFGCGPACSPGRRAGLPFDAHLTPLNVAATLGLPALAFFTALPVLLWRARSRPTDRATWGLLAGLAVDALGQDVEDFRHLWIAFGLAAAPGSSPAAFNDNERRG